MSTTFRPKPDVVSTELEDDESVLLDLKTRRYYSLNDTGTRVWSLLQEGHGVAGIAEAIAAEWDVATGEAEAYVHRFLEDLSSEGLVETVDVSS